VNFTNLEAISQAIDTFYDQERASGTVEGSVQTGSVVPNLFRPLNGTKGPAAPPRRSQSVHAGLIEELRRSAPPAGGGGGDDDAQTVHSLENLRYEAEERNPELGGLFASTFSPMRLRNMREAMRTGAAAAAGRPFGARGKGGGGDDNNNKKNHELLDKLGAKVRNLTRDHKPTKGTNESECMPRLIAIDVGLVFQIVPGIENPRPPFAYIGHNNTVVDGWGQRISFPSLAVVEILNSMRTGAFRQTALGLVGGYNRFDEDDHGSWVPEVLHLLKVRRGVPASVCVQHVQFHEDGLLPAGIALARTLGLRPDQMALYTRSGTAADAAAAQGVHATSTGRLESFAWNADLALYQHQHGFELDTLDSESDAVLSSYTETYEDDDEVLTQDFLRREELREMEISEKHAYDQLVRRDYSRRRKKIRIRRSARRLKHPLPEVEFARRRDRLREHIFNASRILAGQQKKPPPERSSKRGRKRAEKGSQKGRTGSDPPAERSLAQDRLLSIPLQYTSDRFLNGSVLPDVESWTEDETTQTRWNAEKEELLKQFTGRLQAGGSWISDEILWARDRRDYLMGPMSQSLVAVQKFAIYDKGYVKTKEMFEEHFPCEDF